MRLSRAQAIKPWAQLIFQAHPLSAQNSRKCHGKELHSSSSRLGSSITQGKIEFACVMFFSLTSHAKKQLIIWRRHIQSWRSRSVPNKPCTFKGSWLLKGYYIRMGCMCGARLLLAARGLAAFLYVYIYVLVRWRCALLCRRECVYAGAYMQKRDAAAPEKLLSCIVLTGKCTHAFYCSKKEVPLLSLCTPGAHCTALTHWRWGWGHLQKQLKFFAESSAILGLIRTDAINVFFFQFYIIGVFKMKQMWAGA